MLYTNVLLHYAMLYNHIYICIFICMIPFYTPLSFDDEQEQSQRNWTNLNRLLYYVYYISYLVLYLQYELKYISFHAAAGGGNCDLHNSVANVWSPPSLIIIVVVNKYEIKVQIK